MGERSVYDWATEYHQKGYTVIPIEEGGKKPVTKWQAYQKKGPEVSELEAWFKGPKERANLALVSGGPSTLVVLDFDYRHGGEGTYKELLGPDLVCPRVHTGGGGLHLYYRSGGVGISSSAGVLPGFDIRGDGGYVLAPPSRTVSTYTWDNKGEGIPELKYLPTLPDRLLKVLLFKKPKDGPQNTKNATKAGSFLQVQFLPATEGSRNATAARVAGSIARCCCSYTRGLNALRLWNRTYCVPSLPEPELASVWSSIWSKHTGGNYTASQ